MSTEWVNQHSLACPPQEFIGVRFWVRAWARLLDVLIHGVLWFALMIVFAVGAGLYAGMNDSDFALLTQKLSIEHWHNYLAPALGSVLYHAVMERMCGAPWVSGCWVSLWCIPMGAASGLAPR